MNSSIVEQIINKINEYNLGLLTEYKTKDRGHCILTNSMIMFYDEIDQKPETVATNILVLKEIEDIKNIKVMDSFVYDDNKNYICGEEAHNLVKQSIISKAFLDAIREKTYKELMNNTKIHEC